jgi:hypothetical protein
LLHWLGAGMLYGCFHDATSISGCWDDLHPRVPLVAWSSCYVAMLLCPYLALQGEVYTGYISILSCLSSVPLLGVIYGDEAHSLPSPVSEYVTGLAPIAAERWCCNL